MDHLTKYYNPENGNAVNEQYESGENDQEEIMVLEEGGDNGGEKSDRKVYV